MENQLKVGWVGDKVRVGMGGVRGEGAYDQNVFYESLKDLIRVCKQFCPDRVLLCSPG